MLLYSCLNRPHLVTECVNKVNKLQLHKINGSSNRSAIAHFTSRDTGGDNEIVFGEFRRITIL